MQITVFPPLPSNRNLWSLFAAKFTLVDGSAPGLHQSIPEWESSVSALFYLVHLVQLVQMFQLLAQVTNLFDFETITVENVWTHVCMYKKMGSKQRKAAWLFFATSSISSTTKNKSRALTTCVVVDRLYLCKVVWIFVVSTKIYLPEVWQCKRRLEPKAMMNEIIIEYWVLLLWINKKRSYN